MNTIDRIANFLGNLLQILIIGWLLAWLRNKHRWVYYPLKWFFTLILTLQALAIIFYVLLIASVFLGVKNYFSDDIKDFLYFAGNYRNLGTAGFYFLIGFYILGSIVGNFFDKVIFLIENWLYSGDQYNFDLKTGKVNITNNTKVWVPTPMQSFWWNLYGFVIFNLFLYRIFFLN